MKTFLPRFFRNSYNTIVKMGVSENMEFLEKKKTEVINILVTLSIPVVTFFAVLNLTQDRYLMATFNAAVLLTSIVFLIMNSLKNLVAGRILITVGGILIFGAQAILFRNGTENFLIPNLIVSLIFFSNKKIIYSMAIINCLAFIGIKIVLNSSFYYSSVPFERVVFNTSWGIGMAVLALLFFKFQQSEYLKEIEAKNKELESLNHTKTKLFSIISHDLRSPVAQLKSMLDLVNKAFISKEEFNELTQGLTKQLGFLQTNLDDLLIWSQNQMAGIKAMPKSISVRAVVDEINSLLQEYGNTKNITISNLTSDVPVWIDPDHLKLVLRNLLSNAIKFSNNNSTIEFSSYETNQNALVVAVKDHGVGMSEDTINHIFSESFHTTIGTAQEKGTGLGLKLCKEFLDKSNSSIQVESTPGKGTTFYITIPLAR